MFWGVPVGLWDIQDTGTTPKGWNPWDVAGTPSGTVGQTGHWDNSSKMWESLGCPGESRLDCGTYRTLGQLPKHWSP